MRLIGNLVVPKELKADRGASGLVVGRLKIF